MYLSSECLYFGSPSTGLLTAVLISLLKATLQIEGLKNTAQGRRPSLKITLKSTRFLNNTTDTLLNVFLAIAVDNLANAQILTEDEENEKLERQRKREENKKKYSQKPQKGKGWGKAGAKLPVVMAINHFVRKRNAHASTVADPNNVWSVSLYHFSFFRFLCYWLRLQNC